MGDKQNKSNLDSLNALIEFSQKFAQFESREDIPKKAITSIKKLLDETVEIHGDHPAYLECKSYALVSQLKRAMLVTTVMSNLRALREEQSQFDLYLAHEKHVQRLLGDRSVTTHGFNARLEDHENKTELWNVLKDITTALKSIGYECFLTSGTLLGVVRNGDFIPFDDDIDLAIVLKASGMSDAVDEWVELKAKLIEIGIFDANKTARVNNHALYKLLGGHDVPIDLFPCWITRDKVFIWPHTKKELVKTDVLPLVECNIPGVYLPNDPEKMLVVNYGDGWRTPDQFYRFNWGRARNRFGKFLNLCKERAEEMSENKKS